MEEVKNAEEDQVEGEQESHDLSEMSNAIMGYGLAVWLANIGVMCTKEAPQERPTLREVEASLEKLVTKIHEGF